MRKVVEKAATRSATRRSLGHVVSGVACLAAMLFYGQMTRLHLPVWRNGLSLWTHAMEHVPQLPVVQIQYANTLHQVGRDGEAVCVLECALESTQLDSADRNRILQKLDDWRN
jgi:hypothetical protein